MRAARPELRDPGCLTWNWWGYDGDLPAPSAKPVCDIDIYTSNEWQLPFAKLATLHSILGTKHYHHHHLLSSRAFRDTGWVWRRFADGSTPRIQLRLAVSLALSHVKDILSLERVMTLSGTAVHCRSGMPQVASSPGMTGNQRSMHSRWYLWPQRSRLRTSPDV